MSRDEAIRKLIRELSIRGYSSKTVVLYTGQVQKFFEYVDKTPFTNRDERIKNYLELFGDRVASKALAFSALKFFYIQVARMNLSVFSMRFKRPLSLPPVLSQQDVSRILSAVTNEKHKCMLALLYGSGLRVGELVALCIQDIDWDRKKIHIRRGKGAKDRVVVLPASLKEPLEQYCGERKGTEPVFKTRLGTHYETRTVQHIFKRALSNSGVKKKASCHTLRHSFATSLLEHGTDIRVIQSQLGHRNLKTTMVYTHITDDIFKEIKSPLDNIATVESGQSPVKENQDTDE